MNVKNVTRTYQFPIHELAAKFVNEQLGRDYTCGPALMEEGVLQGKVHQKLDPPIQGCNLQHVGQYRFQNGKIAFYIVEQVEVKEEEKSVA